MVVMAALFIRQQPTFIELFGDIQNNGKFISMFFFLIIQIAFQSLSSLASLAALKGSVRMENTFYIVILQFVCKIFLTLKWFPFSLHL